MTPQKLMDAMNYLPEALLERTDALRRRKGFSWKPWVALAACLCLVVGLWFVYPGVKAGNSVGMDNGYAENDGNMEAITDQSGSIAGTAGIVAYVYEVYDDYITVKQHKMDALCDCPTIVVKLDELEEVPQLSAGQKIRIYTNQEVIGTQITPYKIEIEEE